MSPRGYRSMRISSRQTPDQSRQVAQKGPDARRRPKVAREAYSLYVERADQFSSRLATGKGRRSTRRAGRQRSRWAFFSNLLRIDDLVRLRPENDPLLHGLHDEA